MQIRKGNRFIDRTGEKYTTKEGEEIEIIKCEGFRNCTIRFSDGTIIENVKFSRIDKGTLKKPYSHHIGEIYTMNDGNRITIIKADSWNNCAIRYEDGTIMENLEYSNIKKGNVRKPISKIGEKYVTNEGYCITIISEAVEGKHQIQFENGVIITARYQAIILGNVSNPYHRSVHGIGYTGIGKYNKKDYRKLYDKWKGILQRGYCNDFKFKNPTYKNVTVFEEWHCLQNFGAWYEENYKPHMQRWELDKDICKKGNKLYSPTTCFFVPRYINTLFTKSDKIRGDLPIGVGINVHGSYFSRANGTTKVFPTILECFEHYKLYKENRIKKVADEWRGKISEECYKSMYNWVVEITD